MSEIIYKKINSKFFTTVIYNFIIPLDNLKHSIHKYIPELILTNNSKYTVLEIQNILDSFYGASLTASSYIKEENLIWDFTIDILNVNENVVNCLNFINNLLFDSLLNTHNIGEQLKSLIEKDKIKTMNLPLSQKVINICINKDNNSFYSGDLDFKSLINLNKYMKNYLLTSYCYIYVLGNYPENIHDVLFDNNVVNNLNIHKQGSRNKQNYNYSRLEGEESIIYVARTLSCQQNDVSKIPNSYTLQVLSMLLGGNAHSLLFKELRENLGLVYYASTRYLKSTGQILFQTAFDKKNQNEVNNTILDFKRNLLNNDIDNNSFNLAKSALIKMLIDLEYSPTIWAENHLNFALNKENFSKIEEIKKIKNVCISDIKYAIELLKEDSIAIIEVIEKEGLN